MTAPLPRLFSNSFFLGAANTLTLMEISFWALFVTTPSFYQSWERKPNWCFSLFPSTILSLCISSGWSIGCLAWGGCCARNRTRVLMLPRKCRLQNCFIGVGRSRQALHFCWGLIICWIFICPKDYLVIFRNLGSPASFSPLAWVPSGECDWPLLLSEGVLLIIQVEAL